MSHEVICQDCGAPGLEDDTDLMPGTCPTCFDRRVAPVFARAMTLPDLIAGLIEAGCQRERIARHIGGLAKEYGIY